MFFGIQPLKKIKSNLFTSWPSGVGDNKIRISFYIYAYECLYLLYSHLTCQIKVKRYLDIYKNKVSFRDLTGLSFEIFM